MPEPPESATVATRRRDFLKYSAGALAGLLVLPASRRSFAQTVEPAPSGRNAFPQGVASADPQPDAVLLWSRVEPLDGETYPEAVAQVSRSPEFGNWCWRRR